MSKVPFHLPTITVQKDRDKREERRSIAAAKVDLLKRQNKLNLEIETTRERLAREQEDVLKAQKQRQLAASINALDKLNHGNAHKNFHGIIEISETYNVPLSTLRRQYIEHRATAQARLVFLSSNRSSRL